MRFQANVPKVNKERTELKFVIRFVGNKKNAGAQFHIHHEFWGIASKLRVMLHVHFLHYMLDFYLGHVTHTHPFE